MRKEIRQDAASGGGTPPPHVTPLRRLVEEIDLALEGPAAACAERLKRTLGQACRSSGLLAASQCLGDASRYQRHVLHADPSGRYAVVALVWEPGQFSPVHGHETWCSYGVARGELQEVNYLYEADVASARPHATVHRPAGSVCFSPAGLDDIHRLGNASARTAVSVHVYGVDGARVGTHVNRVVPLLPH